MLGSSYFCEQPLIFVPKTIIRLSVLIPNGNENLVLSSNFQLNYGFENQNWF